MPALEHDEPLRLGSSAEQLRHFLMIMQLPSPAGNLTKVLAGLRHTFVVADATLPDCPLVYASEG